MIAVTTIIVSLAIFPFAVPRFLSVWRSDIIFRIPTKDKVVFLTIDDAPTEGTPAILDALKRHNVRATFFIISGRIRAPEQIDAILKAGHSVGNHMATSRAGWKLSHEDFVRDFDRCTAALRPHSEVRFFRPPSGYATKQQVAYANSNGMQAVLGSVYPFDAHFENTAIIVRLASWLSLNGGIIILHDGKDRKVRTAAVLDRLIPMLKRRGYRFGDLNEALAIPNNAVH
ncbi:MAG: polysaccharide deacetylase family protein [Nibricoccus sp.]